MNHRALLLLLLLLVPLAGTTAQAPITDTPLPTATAFIYTLTPVPMAPTLRPRPSATPIPPTLTPTITLTPSPTVVIEGVLLGALAEPVFPAGLRLRVDLMGEAVLLQEVRLELSVPGRPPIVLFPTLEELTPDPNIRAIEYVWLAPEDDLPPIFSVISYRWTLSFSDGSAGLVSGQVMFTDPAIAWTFSQGAEGGLTFVTADRQRPALLRALGPVYERVASLGGGNRPEARYIIFDDALAPECAVLENTLLLDMTRCMPGTPAAAYQGGGFVELREGPGLEVEVTRDLLRRALGRQWARSDVSAWWPEALARWYAPELSRDALQTSRDALRAGLRFSAAEMRTRPEDVTARQRWDAQAYGMVLMLLSMRGAADLEAAAAEVGRVPLDEALMQRYGLTETALVDAWARWVFTSEAAEVYRFTPYLPPTGTHTPTRTHTLTATPSDTPGPTRTPSPTFTRRVATVTRTPSPEPGLPTNTPRSMAEIGTQATPVPIASESPLDGPAGVLGFAVLILAIAALIVIFLMTGRRPKTPPKPAAAPPPVAPETTTQAEEPAKPND